MKNQNENFFFEIIIKIIFILFLYWAATGIYNFFSDSAKENYLTTEIQNSEAKQTEKTSTVKDCSFIEPENPYDQGSGHYAGYEWGARGNNCSGNSRSFIEGCEEYVNQDANYERCIN